MICPNCGTAYRDGFMICVECQVPLVTDEEYRRLSDARSAELERFRTMNMVCVHKAQGQMEADLIRSMLSASGIESFTAGWAAASVHPFTMDGMGEVQIMVREDDAGEARRLIEEQE